jgi:hypothetical protein
MDKGREFDIKLLRNVAGLGNGENSAAIGGKDCPRINLNDWFC